MFDIDPNIKQWSIVSRLGHDRQLVYKINPYGDSIDVVCINDGGHNVWNKGSTESNLTRRYSFEYQCTPKQIKFMLGLAGRPDLIPKTGFALRFEKIQKTFRHFFKKFDTFFKKYVD